MKQNCVVNEKYPAQMLEVAGDLRRAPAKFENPGIVIYWFGYLFDDSWKADRDL